MRIPLLNRHLVLISDNEKACLDDRNEYYAKAYLLKKDTYPSKIKEPPRVKRTIYGCGCVDEGKEIELCPMHEAEIESRRPVPWKERTGSDLKHLIIVRLQEKDRTIVKEILALYGDPAPYGYKELVRRIRKSIGIERGRRK